jgi:hypothetical protein
VVRRKLARRLFLFRGVVHQISPTAAPPFASDGHGHAAHSLALLTKEITWHLVAQCTHHTIPYRTIPYQLPTTASTVRPFPLP